MNSWKIGSLMAVIACSATAIALGQGCVVTVNDPNYDSGTDSDSSTTFDSGTADTGIKTDSGTPDSSTGQTCQQCQQANCAAEVAKCTTALADKSNVISLAGDPYVGKTYCQALNLSLIDCQNKNPNDATALKTCEDGSYAAYSDHNGKVDFDAADTCITNKCATPCQ